MRKLIVAEFTTLDGVIQSPGRDGEDLDGGFEYGGWTIPYWHDDIGKHFFELFSQADALLLGRKTWQIHGTAFEAMEGDVFADAMNGIKKYVVSNTLSSTALWRNSTLIKENVIESIQELKQQTGKDILMDGSSTLIPLLASHDLIDEYALHVYPLVLGKGKRIFPQNEKIELSLIETTPLPTGVVYLRYRPS